MRKHEWWGVPLPHSDWREDIPEAWRFLEPHIHLSASFWKRLVYERGVHIKGNFVWLHLFPPQTSPFTAEDENIDIRYEDDFCLVLNKPAGVLVHPDHPNRRNTCANFLTQYYAITNQPCAIRHIHRLDQDTSGVLLYAKNESAQLFFDEALRKREIRRTYFAIVEGKVSKKQGTISQPIGKDRHHPHRRRISVTGENAITHYRVVNQNHQATCLEIHLETGRTHQIRVHLSAIGHPIVGDTLYGSIQNSVKRQALHAEKIEFNHPVLGKKLYIRAPLPADMEHLIETLF